MYRHRSDLAMVIPSIASRAVQQLHEPDAALHHAPGKQALTPEGLRYGIVQAVQTLVASVSLPRFTSSGACVCIRKASS